MTLKNELNHCIVVCKINGKANDQIQWNSIVRQIFLIRRKLDFLVSQYSFYRTHSYQIDVYDKGIVGDKHFNILSGQQCWHLIHDSINIHLFDALFLTMLRFQ